MTIEAGSILSINSFFSPGVDFCPIIILNPFKSLSNGLPKDWFLTRLIYDPVSSIGGDFVPAARFNRLLEIRHARPARRKSGIITNRSIEPHISGRPGFMVDVGRL